MKFIAVVTLCGLYQGHVDTCLEQKERVTYPSRAECLAHAQEMKKTAETAFWYARIKEPLTSSIRCLTK